MNTKTIIAIVFFSLIVIGASYFILVGNQKPAPVIATYSISDKERPKIKAKETFFDFGEMKVSDEKSAEFAIENTGKKPLQLSNISSSCNCTFVQTIVNGKESDFFGMH